MAKRITTRVTVIYIPLEMGFWGLRAADGTKYEPTNLPEKHRQEGKELDLTLEPLNEDSMNMWGQLVRIV